MRIAVIQMRTRPGDLVRTAARMVAQSHAAAERGCDLAVFPCTTLTGAEPLAHSIQGPFYADLFHTLEEVAQEVACPCLVPVVMEADGALVTELVLLEDATVRPIRGAGARKGGGGGATELPLLDLDGERMVVVRSYEELDTLVMTGSRSSYDVVCFVSPYAFAVDDVSSAMGAALAEGRYVDDARQCGTWLVGCGGVGGYGPHVFAGASFVVAPDGRICACAPSFEEDLLVADVGRSASLPAGSELAPAVYDEPAFFWESLVQGLRDYAGGADVAFAFDGSLASLVLTALASDALGPSRVHVLDCVPRGHTRMQVPALLARTLRVDMREPNGALRSLAAGDEVLYQDLAEAQVSLLARETGSLALTAVDKTALALGTCIGSFLASRFAPLGDVYRIDLLDLAHMRNTISPALGTVTLLVEDMPDVVAGDEPLSGEALLERIDDAIALHLEGGRPLAEVARGIGDPSLARVVVSRIDALLAQAPALPACLAVSTCRLSDHLVPHGFSWVDEGQDAQVADEDVAISAEGPDAGERHEPSGHGGGRPELGRMTERDLREAIDLLRDLSLEMGTDWRNPFSEN